MVSHPKPARVSVLSLGRRALFVAAVATMAVAAACGSEAGPNAGVDENDASADARPAPVFPVSDSGGGKPPFVFDAGFEERSPPRDCVTPPGFDDCTNRCGPLRNPCTGAIVKQCGGCQAGADAGEPQVCDLETNSCIKPKINCADLQAECGRVKNSCGVYLDCPAGDPAIECSAGAAGGAGAQECDPDTKKCRPAQAVTCSDLGYECGQVWLGAGPKTNLTNCGDCSNFTTGAATDRPRCSPILRICEPACAHPTTPEQKKAICDAAKAAKGLECGIISDGCGDTVDCSEVGFTCPSGQTCGTGGIANRCDAFVPPTECQAAGRNCGTIKSICSNADISCGECTGTDICNANGVCGPPCVPKKCSDLGSPQCLPSTAPVPDGCGGNVTDCPVCAGGPTACQPNTDGGVGGSCCVPKFSCTNRPPGISGSACGPQLFDNGCGVQLNCACTTGSCVGGSCCSPTACPGPGAAGETCGSVQLGCGASCSRNCGPDPQGLANLCVGGTCCNPEPDNAADWQALPGNAGRCQFNVPNGCGGLVDIACGAGGTCVDAETGPGAVITKPANGALSAKGYCCTAPANSGCNPNNNLCQMVPDACVTGRMVACTAASCPDGTDGLNDEVCAAGACCDPLTCPAANTIPVGGTCGNNAFDRQCGLTCSTTCAPDPQGSPNVCAAGTCCNPEPDNAAEWRSTQPAAACAFNIANGCGGFVDAPCTNPSLCQSGGVQVSDVGTTFASGTCCDPSGSCGGAPKAVGDSCVVPNSCLTGQTVQCACAGGASCFQGNCCAPTACPAGNPLGGACGGTINRGCGQTCTQGCAAGSCFQGQCCAPTACPAGNPLGGSCGGSVALGCGQTCTQGCAAGSCFQGQCCSPTACPSPSPLGGACGTTALGCGATCSRTCAAGSCFQGTCCAPTACPGPAAIGEACGTVPLGCGQTCARSCDTSNNKGNNKCTANVCACTPTPCPVGFVGSMQNGCGTVVVCSGG